MSHSQTASCEAGISNLSHAYIPTSQRNVWCSEIFESDNCFGAEVLLGSAARDAAGGIVGGALGKRHSLPKGLYF